MIPRKMTLKMVGTLCFGLAMLPWTASAQTRPTAGGGQLGRGGGGMEMLQVMGQLDLTPEQQTKVRDLLKETQTKARDAMQGVADATPEERRAKMQDVQKLMADARAQIDKILTADQKKKYYPLVAKNALKQATDLVTAMKTGVAKQDLTDDQKKQLDTLLSDSLKQLGEYKTDADAVSDPAGSTDFTTKVRQAQMELRKQLVDAIGQENAQSLMQSAMQSMRPGMGRTRGGRGEKATTAETEKPEAK